MSDHQVDLERSFELRTQALSHFGKVDADVITHLVNPALAGGAWWPATRQAYRIVRREGDTPAVLVASDGLSDPFDDEDEGDTNGFGLEVIAATGDPLPTVPASWLWDLVWQMSQFAARRGDIAEVIAELGTMSSELYHVRIPEPYRQRFVNAHGRVGVLLGLDPKPLPASIEGPRSPIRLTSIKLLTLDELALAVEQGDEGRATLAAAFGAQAQPWLSSLERDSVLG